MDETLRPLGRGRRRARARSPSRLNITPTGRRSPTRSRSPERGSSIPSTSCETSSSAVDVAQRIDTLLVKHLPPSSSSPPGSSIGATAQEQSGIRGAKRGTREDAADRRGGAQHDSFNVHIPPKGKDNIGKWGTVIPFKANYYEARTAPTWALYKYRVDYTPEVYKSFLRRELFRKVAKDMDFTYVFDGTTLYTPKDVTENLDPNDAVILNVESKEGTQYDIKIKGLGQVDTGSSAYVSIYNFLFRICMRALNMEPMGKNFFDPTAAIQLPAQRPTLRPGFVTSTRRHKQKMLQNETIQKELNSWGMHFDSNLAFRSQQMLSAVALTTWGVVVPTRGVQGVDNLVQTMAKVAGPLSMNVAHPKQISKVQDGRIQSYLNAIDGVLKIPGLQIIFIILPNNKADLYNAVKKRLASELGVLSQCFLAKNVTSKGLMSIATKVVVQMNAKLSGETLKQFPLKNTMFVGFDVYHGPEGSNEQDVGAMVATISPNFARYFSTTSYYNQNDDMSQNIQLDMIKCCQNYQEENGELPDRIIMYRAGVGEGQLREVFVLESIKISEGLKGLYTKAERNAPGLTYIVVSRRINTRGKMKMNLQNPPPGTVVDEVVTLPVQYDFYLSTCPAEPGNVSPTDYNVLRDENGFDADKLQLITYKMCHMYFNWSETCAMPAPCQYALKLVSYRNAMLIKLLHSR